ncbi:MAG: choice-of-anchor L domain-containing protein [Nitrospira sp.]|nr:choice-of-anchor L domain-containing protein [Nitrospira sp.]
MITASRTASSLLAVLILGMVQATETLALSITQTSNTATLGTALGGTNLTINSVTINNGAASQFGTYTGFTSGPVTIGDGIVLSTGQVVQTTPGFNNGVQGSGTTPSTDTGQSGTAAFDNYGFGNIENFTDSNDVASFTVAFTLSAPSQVGFDFVFGSVEYPQFTSAYTDAFLAFLDGSAPANQIVFDSANNPVQVGMSFAGALTTADTNTAFADPHGLLRLQTFSPNELSAGSHTLNFQIGDVNDHILDSAVFISNFRAGTGTGGTNPVPIPEPMSLLLLATGLTGLGLARRRISGFGITK